VFAAEVTALQLAIEPLQDDYTYTECHICIYTDSQTSKRQSTTRTGSQGKQSSKYSIPSTASHPKLRITITWIPDHTNINGNEHADADAKKAAINFSLKHANQA